MSASGAMILSQYLIDMGTLTDPASGGAWPVVYSAMPPDGDQYVAIIDTTPMSEGRYADTGERVTHPKMSVIVRASDYGTGFRKAAEIEAVFDKVGIPANERGGNGQFSPIIIDGDNFALGAAHVLVPTTPMGEEPDTRRPLFTIGVQIEVVQTNPNNYKAVYGMESLPVDFVLGFQNGFLSLFTPQDVVAAGGGGGGGGGDLHLVFNQASPLAVWTITHNLGKFPSATVLDSAGDLCVPSKTEYLNSNTLRLTFSGAMSGAAYLN